MKKSFMDKNMKWMIAVSAAAAILLGGLLLLIAGDTEPSRDGADPAEMTTDLGQRQVEETEPVTEPTVRETTAAEASREIAEKLFAVRIETISDGTAVARLMETMDLENRVAVYAILLQEQDAQKTIQISFDTVIKESDRISFDKEVQGYAQVILALAADAEEVEWSYRTRGEDGTLRDVTVFLTVEDASKLLGNDIKAYGKSANAVQKLLDQNQEVCGRKEEGNGIISGN